MLLMQTAARLCQLCKGPCLWAYGTDSASVSSACCCCGGPREPTAGLECVRARGALSLDCCDWEACTHAVSLLSWLRPSAAVPQPDRADCLLAVPETPVHGVQTCLCMAWTLDHLLVLQEEDTRLGRACLRWRALPEPWLAPSTGPSVCGMRCCWPSAGARCVCPALPGAGEGPDRGGGPGLSCRGLPGENGVPGTRARPEGVCALESFRPGCCPSREVQRGGCYGIACCWCMVGASGPAACHASGTAVQGRHRFTTWAGAAGPAGPAAGQLQLRAGSSSQGGVKVRLSRAAHLQQGSQLGGEPAPLVQIAPCKDACGQLRQPLLARAVPLGLHTRAAHAVPGPPGGVGAAEETGKLHVGCSRTDAWQM